jgi:hypothetical protein
MSARQEMKEYSDRHSDTNSVYIYIYLYTCNVSLSPSTQAIDLYHKHEKSIVIAREN